MSTNEEIQNFADGLHAPDRLPRDDTFRVMAARPTTPTEPVTEPIEGYYHALYTMHQIESEHGYAGVTFHLEEMDEVWELHIYGGNNIEETYDYFESEEAAIEEAESRAADPAESWGENDDGSKVLVDRNTGKQEDLVVNKVQQKS